ncbi:hypothetical protein ACWFR5_25890 [Streptomyces sp. NPDC055092]
MAGPTAASDGTDTAKLWAKFWAQWQREHGNGFEEYRGDFSDADIDAYLQRLFAQARGSRPGSTRHTFYKRSRDWFSDYRRRRDQERAAARERAERERAQADAPVPADSVGITIEREAPPPRPTAEPDTSTPQRRRPMGRPVPLPRGAQGQPPAAPHIPRPGTTRPVSKESSVADTQVARPRSGQGGLAAKHQTDITFGEYLMEMASIAVQAAMDGERSEALAQGLNKVAETLLEIADDLSDDHNVGPEVTSLISGLADQAGDMKQVAQRFASECADAAEAAKLAGSQVAKVYGEDLAAVEDGGLKHASAAAHHA